MEWMLLGWLWGKWEKARRYQAELDAQRHEEALQQQVFIAEAQMHYAETGSTAGWYTDRSTRQRLYWNGAHWVDSVIDV
jgi:hypothetical protein